MPRSKKPRKRYVPRPVDPDPVDLAISRAALVPQAGAEQLNSITRTAWQRLRTGQGTGADWCYIADAINVAERLVQLRIATDRAAEIDAAQEAMANLHARHAERGSWTLRGPEIAAIDAALEIHEVQLQLCTQGELQAAIHTVKRRIAAALAGNASPSARVCVGALGH
jgi:hypothetical protein